MTDVVTSCNLACPECDGSLELRESRYGLFYGCENFPKCRASHGAHPDGSPLGIPADTETKQARIAAHELFDRILTKRKRYAWLAKFNGVPDHIGEMSQEHCALLIAAIQKEF